MTRSGEERLGRRAFVKAAGAAGVAGLAGCAGDGGGDGDGTDTTTEGDGDGTTPGDGGTTTTAQTTTQMGGQTVEMWIFGGQSSAEFGEETEAVIETYEEETGNTVNLSSTPYPQFLDRIQTSFRGGEGPDIVQSDVIWTPLLAANGWLEPLDDRYQTADFATGDFFETSVRTCTWEDELVGVPFMDGEWGLWYYNADMLESAGYDPMNPGMETWPDMIEVANAIQESEGISPVGIIGADTETLTAQWSGFYFTTGEESWLNADDTQAIIDQESGVATAQLYRDLVDGGLIPNGSVNNNQFDVRQLFTSEQTAMYQVGSWERDILTEQSDVRFGITALPTAPNGRTSSMYGGWNWVINANSEVKDAAWSLIENFTTVDAQLRTASLPPAIVEASEQRFADWQDPLGRSVGDTLLTQIENSGPRPVHPDYPQMSQILRGQMQNVILGETGPQQAMSNAASQIDDLL